MKLPKLRLPSKPLFAKLSAMLWWTICSTIVMCAGIVELAGEVAFVVGSKSSFKFATVGEKVAK